MKHIVINRQTAKTGAQMSAGREGSGNTTVGGPPVIGLTAAERVFCRRFRTPLVAWLL